jgi:hypothetical protein
MSAQQAKKKMILLEHVYKKIVTFLNREKYKYIIIGGIAAGTVGEPRVTGDVDIDIIMNSADIPVFLDKLKKAGFEISKGGCLKSALQTGVFRIAYKNFYIDFLIASTELEKEAFERSKKRSLFGVKANFPAPEDMILLKIIPGRDKDLLDAKNIVLRHKGKLDIRYLKTWAMKLCEEAKDMRIWNELKKLLDEE